MSEVLPDTPNVINPNKLRVIERVVASVVIISKDDQFLMGRKDPDRGGVYPNAWHIAGGGTEDGETLEQAARREASEEVLGIDFSGTTFRYLDNLVDYGETEKTLKTGERVWCKMQYNRFEVRLPLTAAETTPQPGSDLTEVRWFPREELAGIEQIPDGKKFFAAAGYL